MTDVIIVGAGAAGLMAARVLRAAGRDVLVLESSNRVGGRVMTLNGTLAGIPVELGAEFIHGDAPITRKLLDEARLVTVPVLGDHFRSDDGELSPQGPVWKRMSRVFRYMNPDRKTDRSFAEFLDGNPGGRALSRERQLARGFIEGFNGADASLISEKSIAQQGNPTEGAAEAARIVAGYGSLIDYMSRDLTRSLRTGERVTHIERQAAGVTVTTAKGEHFAAGAAILTVPLPMLQDNSITLTPELPAVRSAANLLVMGHVAHVGVIVKERFWEKKVENVSFVHSPERPFNVWWTQNPIAAPLMVAWSGGPAARELMTGGNVENVVLREIARVFAMQKKRAESLVDSIHYHSWSSDPNTLGAYSYAGVGGAFAARNLARSFGNRIYFAGEATNSGSSGTVEGALASGKRAAEKFLEENRS
jgi:monoamine oxidase